MKLKPRKNPANIPQFGNSGQLEAKKISNVARAGVGNDEAFSFQAYLELPACIDYPC
jgi:hypothetical protein